MSITYLNSNTSTKDSLIKTFKHTFNPIWKEKEKYTGNLNQLSTTFGASYNLILPMCCAYDQYVLKVPASFNYRYITILANDTVTTALLSNDKCEIGNNAQITLPIRYITTNLISNAGTFITHDGELILGSRSTTSALNLSPKGIFANNPVVPVFNNYDMHAPSGDYCFYKNCELDDFTIVKV